MSALSTGSGPLSPLGQQALEWARYRKVFPCWPRGKPPMIKGGFLKATQDPALVQQWWTQWPNANIGLPTGHENGIIVVDPDGEEGERLLALVEKKFGKLPPTVEIETGKGRG
jgi:Bifunctional DNA primase/polymerase, N-terminal